MRKTDVEFDALAEVRRALTLEAEAILDLVPRVGHQAEHALKLMYECQGKVVIVGMGKSGLIGRKIAATLSSTGTPSIFMHPADAIHGDLGVLSRNDIVIALSNSGSTAEVIKLLAPIRRMGIPLIAMTGNPHSEMAKRADIHLDVGVTREACPLNLAPTSSTTAAVAMGDALAVTLLAMRGFRPEDYAVFHPGGNLGRKLVTTVADLMETGDKLPLVREDQLMKEVVDEVMQKNYGITSVVDAGHKLVGSFSAGDLLRLHIRDRSMSFLDLPVSEFMHRKPRSIDPGSLGAQALHDMEKNNIRALFVVNSENEPIGIIGLYEVLKAIDF